MHFWPEMSQNRQRLQLRPKPTGAGDTAPQTSILAEFWGKAPEKKWGKAKKEKRG